MLALADVGAGIAASLLLAGSTTRVMWALALLPGWVVLAKLLGLYDRDQRSVRHLTVDELPAIAAWAAVGVGVLGLILPLTPAGTVSLAAAARAWLAATVTAALLARRHAVAVAAHHAARADRRPRGGRAGRGGAAKGRAVPGHASPPGRPEQPAAKRVARRPDLLPAASSSARSIA